MVVSGRRWVACLLALSSSLACAPEPFDTTRRTPPRGTLGQEVFRLFHRDLVREAPRRADGFEAQKDGFVRSVDHLFPEDELSETQAFLVRLLPRYDDGTLPDLTRRVAGVLSRLEDDDEALRSLAAGLNRSDYVSRPHRHGLSLRLANFPEFIELSKRLLDLALEHDGLDDTGARRASEPDELDRLLSALSKGMQELELSVDDQRDAVLLADLLLSDDPRLASAPPPPTVATAHIVARDVRGMARVAIANGAVPAPFADLSPVDGLPDIDLDGNFVDASGRAIVLAPFADLDDESALRDSFGRALMGPRLVYDYVDLDRTMLAGVLRDGRTLIERGLPMKGVRTLEAFLGERDEAGLYRAEGNALLDLLHAGAVAIDMDEAPDFLELLETLLESHEPTLVHVLIELEEQNDIADRYDVSLRAGNTMFEDMLRVIRKILRVPGLAEDLLDTLENPALLQFPTASVRLVEHKKALITEADFDAGRVFTTPVDRSRPDRGENQSLHQRMLHLIRDTKGVRYEPRFSGVPLGFIFEIEDLAEFYLLSMIGESQVPSLVSRLTGLPERPSPEDLARFINHDQDFGNPIGNDGLPVKDNDGDTLYAVSASGMREALTPLVALFHRHGQLELLFEVFDVLYVHWPSPESDYQDQSARQPRYAKLSGIRYYEPLLADVYTNAEVLAAARTLLIETRSLRTSSGKTLRELLLAAARRTLTKDAALTTRSGARQVTIDGERITPLSPFDLVRAGLEGVDQVVSRRAKTEEEWDEVSDALSDIFAELERTGPTAGRLKNPRMKPIAVTLVRFLAERARKHRDAGDLRKWIREDLVENAADAITSEELPAALDLLHVIDEDERLSELLTALRDELLDDDRGFGDLLVLTGDLLAGSKDASLAVPFTHFLGREIHPDERLLFHAASTTRALLEADGEDRLLVTARRGLEATPDGELFIDGLLRAIKQANRINPVDTGPMAAEDVHSVVGTVGRWMLDDERGLEQFYELVRNRK
jgi:hypothetical protein